MALAPEVVARLTSPDLLAQAKAADLLGHDNIVADCIKQQDWRDAERAHEAALQADRDRRFAEYQKQVAAGVRAVETAVVDVANDLADAKLDFAIALAPNYMKPGSGTLDPTQAADVDADARYFDKALRAAWDKVQAFMAGS